MKSAAFSEEWLAARLAALLPEFPDVSLCVALSGGLDSVTLLAALAASFASSAARPQPNAPFPAARRGPKAPSSAARRLRASSLRAIHIHHGLRPNADAWAAHCVKLATHLRIPLQVIKVHVARSRGGSLEAAARDARYAALADALQPGEVLLTAHQQDDQTETVLLQLLRGAGMPGLAAMAEVTPFARGRLVRPLLTRSRAELEKWARAHQLTWVDDDSNADDRFDRNYLRRNVLPLIRARWPGAGTTLSRAARHAAEARRLLETLARADVECASVGGALSTQRLRALDADRRRNALRFWIARAGVVVPDTRRLDELAGPMLDARADANPQVRWNDVVVERHADVLAIHSVNAEQAVAASRARAWNWRESPRLQLDAPTRGTLILERDRHGPLDLDVLPEVLSVRSRHGGESLRPTAGARTRKLKALFQEAKVPLAERDTLPLLYAQGKLIAVADRWLDSSVHATERSRRRARLRFSR